MKEYYTIGEISAIYNVSTDTLRYYDHIDLLKPWVTGENGYRYYSKAQFEIISTIMLLRSMGTPVEKLKSVLEDSDVGSIRQELLCRRKDIDAEIERLKELKKAAERLDGYIDDACRDESPRLIMRPRMWMFSKPFGTEDELDISEICEVNRLAKKEWTTRASIVSTVTLDNLFKGEFHTYERYGYLSENPVNIKNRYLEELPEQLCVAAGAKVVSLEHREMDKAYSDALEFAAKEGYEPCGYAIERNVLDIYAGDRKNPVMFFEIFIPVRKK